MEHNTAPTPDLAAAIAYFDSQADLSPFAAKLAGWLRELQDARQKRNKLETLPTLADGFGSDNGMV